MSAVLEIPSECQTVWIKIISTDCHSVELEFGPDCLQRLLAYVTSHQRVIYILLGLGHAQIQRGDMEQDPINDVTSSKVMTDVILQKK